MKRTGRWWFPNGHGFPKRKYERIHESIKKIVFLEFFNWSIYYQKMSIGIGLHTNTTRKKINKNHNFWLASEHSETNLYITLSTNKSAISSHSICNSLQINISPTELRDMYGQYCFSFFVLDKSVRNACFRTTIKQQQQQNKLNQI